MKMTISKKLYISIGVLTIVFIGLTIFFQAEIKATKSQLVNIQELPELQALLGARTIDHYKWAEALGIGTLLLGKEFTGQIDHTKCKLGEWYYSFTPPKELEAEYKAIEDPHKRFHATAPKIISAIKEGKHDIAKKIFQEETQPALAQTQEALNAMREGVKKLINRDINHIILTQNKMGTTSLIVYAIILLSFVTGSILFLARPIKRNLSEISDWVNGISAGDLTKNADIKTNDEIASMASGLKDMIGKIKEIIAQTIEASNQVSTAADQIAEANQNFSQRITEQAASIEETSSTMEEMSASIRQTADNAREANKLAQSAKASAETGIKVMGDTINAMDEINKSSNRIANISNVIEEIAFQTNLLALNAAVEAARAGEHGKGFAVVASEIRSLAQRTAQSAKEITGLIEDSVNKTGKGVQLAQELNKKLEEISIGVKKVADLMDEVATSAQEQASGINQVNTAVTQIDQMTQQNAALIEETSASAEELAAQAKELMNLIAFFKVEDTFGSGKRVEIEKKMIHHREPKRIIRTLQPALVHASGKTSASTTVEGKSNGGFEEF